jgi:hypothetical protein
MSPTLRLVNCTVMRGGRFVQADLWVKDRVIIDPQEYFFKAKREVWRAVSFVLRVLVNCLGHAG